MSFDSHRRPLSRRQFIADTARTAVAATAATASPLAALQASTAAAPWKMRLSTSSIHFLHLPIEQACEQIAGLGFESVDVWSAHAGCPHLDDVANRLGADGLANVLTRNQLKLFAFSVYRGGYPRYAQLLGDLGGGVAVRGSSGPCEPRDLTPRMQAFLDSLQPEIELAEQHNSYLAIENHGHALLHSLDSLKAFVDLNQSPRLGIALAPYHLQAGKTSVEDAIATCGKQLLFFYAWQHAPGIQQLPGYGPTDFTPWLSALADIDYQGYVNPFMHGDLPVKEMAGGLAKSRKYLQECFEKTRSS
jgi:sugar phosphate isomerase/epimerase